MKESTKSGLDRYSKYRIPTGGFLRCVLQNDLIAAVLKADEDNLRDLHEIVIYILDNLHIRSYGSVKDVNEWIQGRHKV